MSINDDVKQIHKRNVKKVEEIKSTQEEQTKQAEETKNSIQSETPSENTATNPNRPDKIDDLVVEVVAIRKMLTNLAESLAKNNHKEEIEKLRRDQDRAFDAISQALEELITDFQKSLEVPRPAENPVETNSRVAGIWKFASKK